MLLKIMLCIYRSSDGISIRRSVSTSASEDQYHVLHAEVTRLYAEA